MWLQLHMHQIVGVDLNTRLFPSSNHHEGEPQATRGCQTYGEAASTVLIKQNVSQLFELFFKGFQNPLWLPYLDNDNLTLPCEFSFETDCQDGRFLEIFNIIIHPCILLARDTELNQLKTLVEQLADKVNARGDTPAERLAAVEHRVDEVATHGVRLGTTLGLAAMATHTDVDYSTRPRGFRGGAPEDIEEIELILERLDGHGDAIAELTHPQSVLNRLFD
jgi:hypothetical protein